MKTALVFGSSGGIGSAVTAALPAAGYNVVAVPRTQLDLAEDSPEITKIAKMHSVLSTADPDAVIFCAGVLHGSFSQVFDVNVASCWHIIQYYLTTTPAKPVKILLVGSSAYASGRKNYPLYSASKAALHNLVQGCQELFANTQVTLSLLHPSRIRSRMSENLPVNTNELTAQQVADELIRMCSECSQITEMR